MGLDSNRSCQSGEQWRWKESGVVPIPAVTSSLQKQDQKRRFSGNGGHLWLCRIALSPPVINTAPSPLWERTILLRGWKQELHKETVEINRVVFWADWLNSFIPHTFAKHLLCPTSLVAQQQSARLPREKIGMPSPESRRSPEEGNGNPLQYSCLGKSHGQRSLVHDSPWGRRVGHDFVTEITTSKNS